jgi:hypothetical protein
MYGGLLIGATVAGRHSMTGVSLVQGVRPIETSKADCIRHLLSYQLFLQSYCMRIIIDISTSPNKCEDISEADLLARHGFGRDTSYIQ